MNVTGLAVLLMLPIHLMHNNVDTFIKVLSCMFVFFCFLQEIPIDIKEDKHKAMFYWVTKPFTSKYLFESSLFPSEYLAFEPDSNVQGRSRLILRHIPNDEVDESAVISLS